ncbi:MAG TPA: hypothetical protein VLB68_23010 [Pyrinomonadaceae bacterium]|nr:hypothetical protein [Pyrinomonadaceae bacterium]
MRPIFYFLVMVACTATPATSQIIRGDTQAQRCPDERTYTGKYRNYVFGFSMIIPTGLKGYWNSARCAPDERHGCVCMGDHGRFIPLSDTAGVEAFVGWQMESEWALRDHQNQELAYLKDKQGVEQLRVLSSKYVWLRRVKARRFVVHFNENNKSVVVDQIIALYQGVEYQLILHTLADRYQKDRRVFEKLVASWKLTRRV